MIKTAACDKFTDKYFFDFFMQTQSFQLIPVIDLMRGQVVHAKLGQRERYAPINSRLCGTSNGLDVVVALLKLYPFKMLYIADIDAILGNGNHDALIEKINQTFPNLAIWLDSGTHQTSCKAKPVLGSESMFNLESYLENKNSHVLSLDFNAQGAMGISDLHETAKFWPDEVICMTLNAVGSGAGADTLRLQQLIEFNKARKNPAKLYAAGGVRNIDDLQTLASMRLAGALMASALHNGQITSEDIAKFYAP